MKLVTIIGNIFLLVIGISQVLFTESVAAAEGIRTIVIDAGHGGKDPGAVGFGHYEKTINLGVALKLGRMINETMPSIKVVYTRKDDRFITLSDRSKIAAEADADLFMSIHTNANENRTITGTETYVMGMDKGNRNLSVVMRENAVISLEADYTSRYEGYDPSSSESLILFSLMQYAYQGQSLSLAQLIQSRYGGDAGRKNRGVKQAGFLVLWRTPMPSVLTEVGFISNATEAKFLASTAGQEKVATALLKAVQEYKNHVDSRTMASGAARATTAPKATAKTAPKTTTASKTTTAAKTTAKTTTVKWVSDATKTKSSPSWVTTPTSSSAKQKRGTVNATSKDVVFRIQVKSATSKLRLTASNFGTYASNVTELRVDGRYKYYYGARYSYQEALLLQRDVRRKFPDAFMVAFRKGVPVPLADVIRK